MLSNSLKRQLAGHSFILGIEAYVAARTRFDRDPSYDKPRYHLVLLANQIGLAEFMPTSTKAWVEGQYYKPRIDHDIMAEQFRRYYLLEWLCWFLKFC